MEETNSYAACSATEKYKTGQNDHTSTWHPKGDVQLKFTSLVFHMGPEVSLEPRPLHLIKNGSKDFRMRADRYYAVLRETATIYSFHVNGAIFIIG